MKIEAIKVVDAGRGILAGWGIPFGGPLEGRDLDLEFFEKDTDFALDWFPNDGRPLLYGHGTDPALKASVVGRQVSHKVDEEVGIWIETQLNMAHRYAEAIMELAGEGVLGFSSGAMKHLVVRDDATGKIMRWPWVEQSLTPTPSNAYALIGSEAAKHFDILALEMPEPMLKEIEPTASPKGLTFRDHAERVLADAQELVVRSRSLADLRAKEGRALATVNRERLADLLPHLQTVTQELGTLLEETEPATEKGLALFAEYQRIVARLQGVPVQ